jgi:integrase
MVPVKALDPLWSGLMHRFKLKFGVAAMVPKQKNPFTRDQIEGMLDTLQIDGFALSKTMTVSPEAVWSASARAYIALSAQTGMRKADSLLCGTAFTTGDLSRGSISWLLGGTRRVAWLTPQQLRNLGPNDYIVIRPPASKCDPFCLVWGSRPIYGRFHPTDKINMARALRDLFLVAPVDADKASSTPLFIMDDGAAMKGTFAETMIPKLLKAQGLTVKEAGEFSAHSFRIYLACALRAAGASDAEIQALCRWSSLDSLRIYACLDAPAYTSLIGRAMGANTNAVRVHTLPFLDLEEVIEASEVNPQAA